MDSRHLVDIEPVRKYLLGKLGDQAADALEAEYFTDRLALIKLHEIETGLIRDYLQAKLSEDDRESFEQRYCQVPHLRRKLEAIRLQLDSEAPAAKSRFFMAWPAAAAACLLLASGGVYWLARESGPVGRPKVAESPRRVEMPIVTLLLLPGTSKGAAAGPPVLPLPGSPTRVRLVAQLLDRKAAETKGAVILIDADGHRKAVWESPPVRSVVTPNGETAAFELDSMRLPAGYYLLEVSLPGGSVLDSYPFQVEAGR